MKTVFYDRNGMVGIIDSVGKNGYVLDVSKNDGENYINKKWLYGQKMIHQLKTLDHQLKTKAEISDEEMGELIKRFPWFAGHEAEAKGILRGFLSGLLLYAVRENKGDLAGLILQELHLDRQGLEKREIKSAAILEADSLETDDVLNVLLKPKRGGFIGGTWRIGEPYVYEGDRGYRIGGRFLAEVRERYRKLKYLQENWEKEEEGFLSFKLQSGIRIACRNWRKNGPGEKYYQFLVLQEESPVLRVKVTSITSFFRQEDLSGGIGSREEAARKAAELLLEQAERKGDRYAELSAKEALGTVTEEECEVLYQEDGQVHLIQGIVERKVKDLKVLSGQYFPGSFFSRGKRFSLMVSVDGNEGRIIWFPEDPEHFEMDVYHHREGCRLSPEQVEYMRKVTERMMP